MPPNKILHADTVENLTDLLKAQLDRKIVQVRVSTFGLVIRRDPLTTRVPDIAVFVRKNVVELRYCYPKRDG
jgi:Uma2 family endonuclease